MDLSDILKGVLGGSQPSAPAPQQGGGQAALITSLLPLVLQMLQGRQAGAASVAPGGGGGVLDSLGGLGGLVSAFTQNGLGDVVGSWIGRGQNLPVSPDQLSQVLGPGALQELAAKTGASHGDVTNALSQLLPHVVDKLTPDGAIPEQGISAGAGDLLKSLGLSPG